MTEEQRSTESDPFEELPVVKDLPTRVAELAAAIRTSERVARTAKRAAEKSEAAAKKAKRAASRTHLLMAVVLVVILILCYFIYELQKIQEVSCENTNEARKAQVELWTNILDAQLSDPTRTPEQHYNSRVFREYVKKNFAQRDCKNLGEKYEKPQFPRFKVPSEEKDKK